MLPVIPVDFGTSHFVTRIAVRTTVNSNSDAVAEPACTLPAISAAKVLVLAGSDGVSIRTSRTVLLWSPWRHVWARCTGVLLQVASHGRYEDVSHLSTGLGWRRSANSCRGSSC
jgi:hypothetical protein